MPASLNGKSVIVTGGSPGIGKGIARVFASHGANVMIVARHVKDAEAAAQELSSERNVVGAFAADVTRPADMEAMAKAAFDRHASVDVLCANVEDIGHAAAFLASREAALITGQTIVVDGGQIVPESLEALASA